MFGAAAFLLGGALAPTVGALGVVTPGLFAAVPGAGVGLAPGVGFGGVGFWGGVARDIIRSFSLSNESHFISSCCASSTIERLASEAAKPESFRADMGADNRDALYFFAIAAMRARF